MTDFELLKVLDENLYEASAENLIVLKEGLEDGTYELVEGYPNSILAELLESDGYEICEENFETLNEGLMSGEFEILNEGFWDGARTKMQNLGTRIKTKAENVGRTLKAAGTNLKKNVQQGIRNVGSKLSVVGKDDTAKATAKATRDAETAATKNSNHMRTIGAKGNNTQANMRAAKKIDSNNTAQANRNAQEKQTKLDKAATKKQNELIKKGFSATVSAPTVQAKQVKPAQVGNATAAGRVIKESYSDYELYQLLESNGYTTTEENLSILKEGLDVGRYEVLVEATSLTKKIIANGGTNSFEYKNATAKQKAAYHANQTGKDAAKTVAISRNAYKAGDSQAQGALSRLAKSQVQKGTAQKLGSLKVGEKRVDNGNHNKQQERNTASSLTKNTGLIGKAEKSDRRFVLNTQSATNKAIATAQGANRSKVNYDNKTLKNLNQPIKESYSDYELYQLLESNGYITTEENLSILKEGLEVGRYFIED